MHRKSWRYKKCREISVFEHMAFLSAARASPRGVSQPPRGASLLRCACTQPVRISVCTGTSCGANGSQVVLNTLQALTKTQARVDVCAMGCISRCGNGTNVIQKIGGNKAEVLTDMSIANVSRLDITLTDAISRALNAKAEGDEARVRGDLETACERYERAYVFMEGCHELRAGLLCNWSGALVEMGDGRGGLCKANEAVDVSAGCAPAWRRKALAHVAVGEGAEGVAAWRVWGCMTGRQAEMNRNIQCIQRQRRWNFF